VNGVTSNIGLSNILDEVLLKGVLFDWVLILDDDDVVVAVVVLGLISEIAGLTDFGGIKCNRRVPLDFIFGIVNSDAE